MHDFNANNKRKKPHEKEKAEAEDKGFDVIEDDGDFTNMLNLLRCIS